MSKVTDFNIADPSALKEKNTEISSMNLLDVESTKEDGESKIGLLQAVSLNTLMMFGTGPFITIPFCIASSDPVGPHALIGYAIGALACCCDSFIWGELGALFPYSGGSYIYAQKCLGEKWGGYVSFLFLWQMLITGPMEIASGFIAIAEYLAYVTETYTYLHHSFIAFGCCIICTMLLYRNISDVGSVAVILWVGMCCAIVFTFIAGFSHANIENFESPKIHNTGAFIWSLGNCAKFGVYDFTGYHEVNFIGKDVKNPQRVIPLSCISTCIIVCFIYFLTYLAVMSYLPWDPEEDGFVKLVQDDDNNAGYIMALFCEKLVNRNFGIFFTLVVIYCIFGSCYSLMLGFAQVPYAAAKAGFFFELFGHEHRKGFADFSLLYMGFCTCAFCFVDLEILIEGMLTTMILTMYMSNTLSLVYHRWTQPDCERPYKMPLYPLPVIFQMLMFSFIFLTTDNWIFTGGTPLLELGLLFLLAGTIVFLIMQKHLKKWPFKEPQKKSPAVIV